MVDTTVLLPNSFLSILGQLHTVNTQNISPLNHFAVFKAFSYARMAEGKDNSFQFLQQIGEGVQAR